MADAPVLFFAPFVSSILRMDRGLASEGNASGLGQYHALMEEALVELLTVIGFDRNYRDVQQSFVALVESHVTCQRNVSQGGRCD
jgi:acyl-CoA thioester hydrolase